MPIGSLTNLENSAAKATGDYNNLNSHSDAHLGLGKAAPKTETVTLNESEVDHSKRASGALATRKGRGFFKWLRGEGDENSIVERPLSGINEVDKTKPTA